MPRMSKKNKIEWDFYLDENGRISYNELHFYCSGVGNDMRSEPCRDESSVSICANEEE